MNRILRAALLAMVLFPQVSLAIPPPEFIVGIGAQVAAIASVVFLFLSAAFTTTYQLIKSKLDQLSRVRWIRRTILGIVIISTGSAFGAHFYFKLTAEQSYREWYEESRENRTEILVEEWFEDLEEEEEESVEEVEPEPEPETESGPSFFELHADEGDVVSNEALAEALSGNQEDYILLDARENLEVEAGRIPGATHIRFADLLSGEWKELDEDKYIYVICASSMRGKEVSDFLREKELAAQYLEGGASAWVEFGGSFEGTITFSEAFPNSNYHTYLSTAEVRNKVSQGAVFVDAREPAIFEAKGLAGSYYLALLYTPTEDLEEAFAQIPKGASVITVCSDWINCFDAKMVGIELERRGYTFLGRYNKPDEY